MGPHNPRNVCVSCNSLYLHYHYRLLHHIQLQCVSCDIRQLFVSNRSFHKPEYPTEFPGVSVIKPLLGVDPYLRDNLLSHFRLKYPKFELLFCVEDEHDPVIDLVRSLCREFPHVDARLLIGTQGNIVNPMVRNMVSGYNVAKYSRIWISTSRVVVNDDVVSDLVAKSLDPNVAIVFQLPYFADRPGFYSLVEKISFGCALARHQIALYNLGLVCFVGMSYIVKKPLLDEIGGLAHFGKYLAEDYFLANSLDAKGYQLRLSSIPLEQRVADASFKSYTDRMSRWLKLRMHMVPLIAGVVEPLIESISMGILLSIVLKYLFDYNPALVLLLHFITWSCLDYCLLRTLQKTRLPCSFFAFLFAWFVRELLVFVIQIKARYKTSVIRWGRYKYVVSMGGETSFQRLNCDTEA